MILIWGINSVQDSMSLEVKCH